MIDVLMATYRPREDWLREQVDSVLAQRDVQVNLVRREDAAGAGAAANFSALLRESKAAYVALCDQDDVWLPDKLAKSLARLRELEAECGAETPLLVFCDSALVDAGLHPLPGTNVSRQRVDVRRGLALNRLLVQNFIPGHAMLFNAALRARAGEVPPGAIMHDYWIALVAAAFGRIGFVDEPLALYRQHGRNVLGAATRSKDAGEFRGRLAANVAQARAFAARFGDETPACVRALARLGGAGWLARRRTIVRHGLWKHGLVRNLALLALA